jgi:hypothetical protein
MSGNQGETKSGLVAPAVVIPQLNQAQSRALARGRTIGHYGHGVQPNPFTLRQRAVYEDEGPRWNDGGGALFTARTEGVLRGIQEVGQHRAAARPVIEAIGRRNIPHIMIQNPHTGLPSRMGALGSTTEIPTFLLQRILGHGGPHTPISDLTTTGYSGAPSKRKGKTRKDPRARGGRRRKRRRTKRKRTKKFRKGSKSKTHRGKNFETRKTSKNYNSKRWKRMTGRRTRKSPLFPFV